MWEVERRVPLERRVRPETALDDSAGVGGGPSLVETIQRRRWTVAICAAGLVAVACIYILVATPQYTVTAQLEVQRPPPVALQGRSPQERNLEQDLATQCEVMRSSPILALALSNAEVRGLSMFDGVGSRIFFLKRRLSATPGRRDALITLSLDAAKPDEARRVVDAVIDAYKTYRARSARDAASDVLTVLKDEAQRRRAAIDEAAEKLATFRQAHPDLPLQAEGNDAAGRRLAALADAQNAARAEAVRARAGYMEVARAAGVEVDTTATAPPLAGLGRPVAAADEGRARDELVTVRRQLADARQRYLAGHPIISRLQDHERALTDSIVAAAQVRWVVALDAEADAKRRVDDARRAAVAMEGAMGELARLRDGVARAEAAAAEIDEKILHAGL
ncbi:MAG TPA: Wzz/FepE/Etk N-terminal domain-containing protein, partial [Tepidisphaeraceae bacterium]|nr:Wzz/FepE/Etk N-terminal domain-containing protein [Tepidisphaeraceae bacterium]